MPSALSQKTIFVLDLCVFLDVKVWKIFELCVEITYQAQALGKLFYAADLEKLKSKKNLHSEKKYYAH